MVESQVSRPSSGAALAGSWRLLAFAALVAALLLLAPVAQGRQAANLTLNVTFFANGSISVSLPDGTPVGTTSGPPTVIPAGVYTIVVLGPGGCTQLPLFDLSGPGERLEDDMIGGEVTSETHPATFQPNSTYTWRTDNDSASPVHTFVTSSQVLGTAQVQSNTTPTGPAPPPTAQDVVGSAVVPFRGSLMGTVSAAGKLTLAFKGRSVEKLIAGRYTIRVVDRSSSSGFTVERAKHAPLKVTSADFVGKHTASVDLTAGTWLFAPNAGKTAFSVVVAG